MDADVLLYKFGCSAEEFFDFGEGGSAFTLRSMTDVKNDLEQFLTELCRSTKTKDFLMCLSDSGKTFRYDILPSYKHNRRGKEKPKLYYEIREHVQEIYPWKQIPKLEADDVMGVLATKHPGKYIVATIDKDLKQVPGWHYNWKKDSSTKFVSETEANLMFYRQCLTGDTVDGFSGCPGIGVKNAEKILNQVQQDYKEPTEFDYWYRIVGAYEKKGLDESYALTQARMARILRVNDYNDEPLLWSPK